MSIRILTHQLQQEKTEHLRVQRFQSARSIPKPQTQQETPKQTPFMGGASTRTSTPESAPPEIPIQKQPASPKVGLKERATETTYCVPGGIVARFGRDALKESVALPQEPEETVTTESQSARVQDLPLETETTETNEAETAQPQEQEQAAEQDEEDEAARITIELQSH